jgi:hypothetical protein
MSVLGQSGPPTIVHTKVEKFSEIFVCQPYDQLKVDWEYALQNRRLVEMDLWLMGRAPRPITFHPSEIRIIRPNEV